MNSPPVPEAALAAARDAAKADLRIDGDADDAQIARHAAAAIELCEALTGVATIVREWHDTVPAGSTWQVLAVAPVLGIDGVEGLPAEGAAFALAAGAYAIDIDAAGEGWVRVTAPGAAGRVRVAYSAGLAAEWEGLPAALRQGVVLLTAHLFEARALGGAPPTAVAALWRPWRRMRLSTARMSA